MRPTWKGLRSVSVDTRSRITGGCLVVRGAYLLTSLHNLSAMLIELDRSFRPFAGLAAAIPWRQ